MKKIENLIKLYIEPLADFNKKSINQDCNAEKKLNLISKSYNFLPQKHTIKKSQLWEKLYLHFQKCGLKLLI